MQTDKHPTYHATAKVNCACGNSFTVGSTQEEIHVELCNQCHPFYTGKQNLIDTAGRVDKFQKRLEKQAAAAEGVKGRTKKRADRATKRTRKVDETDKILGKKKKPATEK